MKIYVKNFRKAIELLQKSTGSQAFIAKKMDILPQTLNNIMLGRANPTVHHIYILSIKYGFNAGWIITGEGPMLRDTKQITASAEAEASAARETKEAWQQANEANKALAEARQELLRLTQEHTVLKEANAELLKQLDPKELLKLKKAQEDKDPFKR